MNKTKGLFRLPLLLQPGWVKVAEVDDACKL